MESRLLSLTQAAKLIPTSSGRPPSTVSIWRWCTKGFKTPTGETVRLEHLRFGNRIAVEETALIAFARQCAAAWNTAAPAAAAPRPASRTRKPTSNADPRRVKQIEAARQELASMTKGGAS